MPSSAGSETVYAAKGLDRPINAGESVEDFADYKENKKIAHVYLTLTIAIGNRAKAKAYDMMIFVFGSLLLAFALMGIDVIAVLLTTFAYLFVVGYGIYYRCKFDKEM